MIEHMFKDFDVDNDGRLVKITNKKKKAYENQSFLTLN